MTITANNSPATTAANEKKLTTKSFVKDFEGATILEFVNRRGKGAVVYQSVCDQPSCHNQITIQGFTAVGQVKKYGRFTPPTYCKACFVTFRGQHSPRPAKNARVEKGSAQSSGDHSVPALLEKDLLLKYRRRFEGKTVELKFKQKVSFSNSDESSTPEYGRVLAVSSNGIVLMDDGSAVHESRVYALGDIAEIRTVHSRPEAQQSAVVAA